MSGIRFTVLAPIVVAVAALAIYLPDYWTLILAWGALVVAATTVALELWVRGPVIHLARFAEAVANGDLRVGVPPGRGEIGVLGHALARLRDALATERSRVAEEGERRRQAEQEARESEERYGLAVQGADDGVWEWNLRTGLAFYSSRWKSLLGHADDEIGTDIDEWRRRIHPDDRDAALADLSALMEGRSDRYRSEHRLRHRDGSYRWVLCRGAAIRGAAGRALRLIGLITDITARKRAAEILVGLSEGLDGVRGEAFYRQLVRNFATVLGVQRAFITECADEARRRVRKIAQWDSGGFTAPMEFEIAGTPCDEVINGGRVCLVREGLAGQYPREAGFESYIGIPIFDSSRTVIGHLACLDPGPLHEDLPIEPICALYAVRAGIEMERALLRTRLETGRA